MATLKRVDTRFELSVKVTSFLKLSTKPQRMSRTTLKKDLPEIRMPGNPILTKN
jgi:hypothetical protein